jgi:ornithine carbamoyltransferase
MPHFLDLKDFSKAKLRAMLTEAARRKKARAKFSKGKPDKDQPLKGKAIALIFERPSTRTRFSFEMGVRQLGGEVFTVSGAEMQLGRGETIADTARVVSRYVDGVMIRAAKHETLIEFASAASIPVINGLTNLTHPCQIMTDVLTLEEKKRRLDKLRVAWIGDGNNVCASWIEAIGVLGGSMKIACPPELRPRAEVLDWAQKVGAKLEITSSPQEAVAGVDCVMTDAWVSMHNDDAAIRHKLLQPYQVNSALMKLADKKAIFMHDLPAHRGEEVTDEVFDSAQSVVFDEAENRVHAQKAILISCFSKG